jgi:hypothetical protein
MAPKVLIVLTSHDKIDGTDKPTGWYLVRRTIHSAVPTTSDHIVDNAILITTYSVPGY